MSQQKIDEKINLKTKRKMTEDEFVLLRKEVFDHDLQAKLWPFLVSYRPHDGVETWQMLREDGHQCVKSADTIDELAKVVGESSAQQWRSWMTLEEMD